MPELPPANLEAEQAVLGSVLIEPNAILLIADWLRPSDFFSEKNAWVYQAMLDLHSRGAPIDHLSLNDELAARRQLQEIGGPAFIMDLSASVPTAMHVEYYARIVERLATLRNLIRAAGQVVQLAYTWDPKQDAQQAVELAETLMFSASRSRANGPDLIKASIAPTIDGIEAVANGKRRGVVTGFNNLDAILGRLDKGEVCVLAGRPGRGKSALALDIAANVAERGERVAVFSLEMAKDILIQRLLARTAKLDLSAIRMGKLNDEQWFQLMYTAGRMNNWNMYLDDTPAISTGELRSKVRRLHALHGLDLVIVDYLQLMTVDNMRMDNRTQVVSAISMGLKNLAREMDIPILAVAQLSRAVESRSSPRPILSDLRESGSLEMDAAQVVFLWVQPDPDDVSLDNIIHVAVDKNRHGQTGDTALYFIRPQQRFADLSKTERVPLSTHASYTGGVD